VDQGEKKVAFGLGTTVAMVKQRCLDEQQRKVARLLDENGVEMVQLELGRTYQAILGRWQGSRYLNSMRWCGWLNANTGTSGGSGTIVHF
jgi:hypothetical protein